MAKKKTTKKKEPEPIVLRYDEDQSEKRKRHAIGSDLEARRKAKEEAAKT